MNAKQCHPFAFIFLEYEIIEGIHADFYIAIQMFISAVLVRAGRANALRY